MKVRSCLVYRAKFAAGLIATNREYQVYNDKIMGGGALVKFSKLQRIVIWNWIFFTNYPFPKYKI